MTKNELELKLIEAKAEVIALEKENTWLKSVIEKFADNKGNEVCYQNESLTWCE